MGGAPLSRPPPRPPLLPKLEGEALSCKNGEQEVINRKLCLCDRPSPPLPPPPLLSSPLPRLEGEALSRKNGEQEVINRKLRATARDVETERDRLQLRAQVWGGEEGVHVKVGLDGDCAGRRDRARPPSTAGTGEGERRRGAGD